MLLFDDFEEITVTECPCLLSGEYKSHISEKDLWDIENKYQKEIDRLERENKNLKQQLLLKNSSSQPVKRVQVFVFILSI